MAQREQIFLNAGLNKNEAKVLNYFFEEDKLFSRQIEHNRDMRQPEASVALGTFVEKGWLTIQKVRGKGKGRPQHLYSLMGKERILTELINNLRKEQKKIEETITALDALQKTIE